MSVYSDHPEHTARILAQECKDMLQDTASNCPNKVYRARSLVELSRLKQHLRCFICACGEEDKAAIEEVMEGIDEDRLMSEAINMEEGRHDSFVLRECGRYFMQKTRDFHGAIWCLMESEKKRKTSLVYSVLAKAYLRMVPHVQFFDPSEAKLENALKLMASGSSVQERQWMFHMDFNARNLSTRMTEPENIHRKPSVKCLLRAAKPRHYELSDPRVQMAEKFYLQGKKLHPRNSGLLSELAKLFEGTGRPEEAVKLYETIIVNREISTAFDVVNSYERCGLIFLAMAAKKQHGHEYEQLTRRAEDMFMRAMVLCGEAVAHLPQVGARRDRLWISYSSLLNLLQQSEGGSYSQPPPQRQEELHAFVGEYIEALEAYKKLVTIVNHGENANDVHTMVQKNARVLVGCLGKYLRQVLVRARACVCVYVCVSKKRFFEVVAISFVSFVR
jgi:tetratricopeptide (TPR) repeat protein